MSDPTPTSTYDRLAAEVGEAPWHLLKPHAERGGLFFVDAALDLVAVATAVADDDKETVAAWMDTQQLSCPTLDEITMHAADAERLWTFVIVQPFVFVSSPLAS